RSVDPPSGLQRNSQTFTKLTFWEASHPATLAQCSGSRCSHDLTARAGTQTYGSLSRTTAWTMRARSVLEVRRSWRSSSGAIMLHFLRPLKISPLGVDCLAAEMLIAGTPRGADLRSVDHT